MDSRDIRISPALPVAGLMSIVALAAPLSAQAGAGAAMTAAPRAEGPAELLVHLASGFRDHHVGDAVPLVVELEWAGELDFDASAWGVRVGAGMLLTPGGHLDTGLTLGAGLLHDVRGARGTLSRPGIRLLLGASWLRVEEPLAGTWRQWDLPLAVTVGVVGPAPGLEGRLWAAPRIQLRAARGPSPGEAGWHTSMGGGLSLGFQGHLSGGALAGFGGRITADALVIDGLRPGRDLEWGASLGIGYLHTLF